MMPIEPITTGSECITNLDLTEGLREVVGGMVGVTYSLAYIALILGFLIGFFAGWTTHKRGIFAEKEEPDPCLNDGR